MVGCWCQHQLILNTQLLMWRSARWGNRGSRRSQHRNIERERLLYALICHETATLSSFVPSAAALESRSSSGHRRSRRGPDMAVTPNLQNGSGPTERSSTKGGAAPLAAAPPSPPSLLTRLTACLQYGFVSVAITLFNRAVFSVYAFNFPSLVTLLQVLVSLIFMCALPSAAAATLPLPRRLVVAPTHALHRSSTPHRQCLQAGPAAWLQLLPCPCLQVRPACRGPHAVWCHLAAQRTEGRPPGLFLVAIRGVWGDGAAAPECAHV